MAVYRPTSELELREFIGYWDDSESSVVIGTAIAGDFIVIPVGTITLTGSDRFLSPTPGVHIVGETTYDECIVSDAGLRFIGDGGSSLASAFANWTLDGNGITSAVAGASLNYGFGIIEDVSIATYNWRIQNSNPTDGLNNLTIVHTLAADDIECLFDGLISTSAERDCFSTKRASAISSSNSLIRLFNSTLTNPGVNSNDQAATTHEGLNMEIYSSTLSGNSGAFNIAFAASTDAAIPQTPLINCTITGEIVAAHTIRGCVITLDGDSFIDNPRIIENVRVLNSGSADNDLSIQVNNNITQWGDPDFSIDGFDDRGTGGGTSVFVPSSGFLGTASIENFVCTDKRRGLDLRSGPSHSVSDAVIEASQFSILNASPGIITGSNITTDTAVFNDDPGGITIQNPLLSNTISDARSLIVPYQAEEPSIRDSWSGAVLAAYEIALNPFAFMNSSLSNIYYGGYRIPIIGDSMSTTPKSGGQSYENIHIGSTPLSVVLSSGDSIIVTIPEVEAEETDECVIGGATILAGRIGANWFAVSRPAGTSDADVEYFYKGNLLKAKRFGLKTYL